MPLAISLLMSTSRPSSNHWSAIASTDARSSPHRTENTTNQWKTGTIKKDYMSFAAQISWSATKNRNLDLREYEVTKWRSEARGNMSSQWWWAASINIIMEWNHNIIIYQCWNWSNWEELVSRNAMWCGSTSAESQVMTAKWSQVKSFSQSQKIDKEGLSTRKVKNRNIVNDINIARLCWKSTRRKFS